jgi:hypothetical protein
MGRNELVRPVLICIKTVFLVPFVVLRASAQEPARTQSAATFSRTHTQSCTNTGGICRGGNDVMNADDFWRNNAPARSRRKIDNHDRARSRRLLQWFFDFSAARAWDLPAQTILNARQRVLDAQKG